ncbi:class I SAM-dependent methyltransferase [Nocardiopsis halotolerans]|uniref:class I SAM-dependent methyltransferase n=1 Tax=Nocardiopsis halotolerans TaxID=124252 RepID=UPI0003469A32|nr:class I SAM-dependent methyltransferase [Nocardiopsis halotolerans]
MPEYDDPYARSGQYLDMMIAGWWDHHRAALTQALGDLPADSGPVVDAGAGGGHGTRLIAETLPGARVLAVEPSLPLRTVLLSRVADAPGLRDRVTVDGDDLLSAHLPDRIGGMVMANLLGHFSPHERDRLWEDLAPRLAPGAFVLLNLAAPLRPQRIERTRMSEVGLGERSYVGWAAAEPSGPEQVNWHMTYEVHEGDRVLSRDDVHYDWWTVTEDALRAETSPHRLRVLPHGPAEAGLYKLLPEA